MNIYDSHDYDEQEVRDSYWGSIICGIVGLAGMIVIGTCVVLALSALVGGKH